MGSVFIPLLGAGSLLVLGCGAQAAMHALDARVTELAKAPFETLTMIPADSEKQLRWIAWSETADNRPTSYLALFAGHTGTVAWQADWPDAYSPSVREVTQWRYAGRPVTALTVSFGAAAEQVDLYGLDASNRPVRLAERLGVAVDFRSSPDGKLVLEVFRTPDTIPLANCFVWESELLKSEPCPK